MLSACLSVAVVTHSLRSHTCIYAHSAERSRYTMCRRPRLVVMTTASHCRWHVIVFSADRAVYHDGHVCRRTQTFQCRNVRGWCNRGYVHAAAVAAAGVGCYAGVGSSRYLNVSSCMRSLTDGCAWRQPNVILSFLVKVLVYCMQVVCMCVCVYAWTFDVCKLNANLLISATL